MTGIRRTTRRAARSRSSRAPRFFLRLAEAENILQRASEHKVEASESDVLRYSIAFLKGDHAGMEQEVARGQGKSGVDEGLSDVEAFVAAYSLKGARTVVSSSGSPDRALAP